jgi:hypothetical protein
MQLGVSVFVDGQPCVSLSKVSNGQVVDALIKTGMNFNGFKNVGGREPGYGNLLLLRKDYEAITDKSNVTLLIKDSVSQVAFYNLVVTDVKQIFPTNSPNDLLIVIVSDSRFLSQKNFQHPDDTIFPPHESLEAGGTFVATNEDGIEDLWDLSNTRVTYSSVGGTQDYPTILFRDCPVQFSTGVWNHLNDILALMSHCVYYTGNGYNIYKLSYENTDNQTLVTESKPRLVQKRGDELPLVGFLPETIKVRYQLMDNDSIDQTYSKSETYGGTEDTISGLVKDLYAYNLYDENDADAATYKTDLDTLAGELATLYFDAFPNHKKNNAIYFGLVPFDPSPDCHEIEYYHDFEKEQYFTKVKSIDLENWEFPEIDHDGGSGGSSSKVVFQGVTLDRIEAGQQGYVRLLNVSEGDLSTFAKNHTLCDFEPGSPVSVFYDSEFGYWFTSCRCCSGDDYDCCTTDIWVCICGEYLFQIPTDGGSVTIPDLQDCCSGTCTTSSSLTITLSCTAGTITGTYSQECDGSTDSGSFNSAGLTALCTTSSEATLTATTAAIGVCNPTIQFYNYRPEGCTTDSTNGCGQNFDDISSVTVTVSGVDDDGNIAACNCNIFNGTWNLTLESRSADGAVWSFDPGGGPCSQMEDTRIEVVFRCGPCSTTPNALLSSNDQWSMSLIAYHGAIGSCFRENTPELCFTYESSDDPTAVDTGTIDWPGRHLPDGVSSVSRCTYCMNETNDLGDGLLGQWQGVTVRIQTS